MSFILISIEDYSDLDTSSESECESYQESAHRSDLTQMIYL